MLKRYLSFAKVEIVKEVHVFANDDWSARENVKLKIKNGDVNIANDPDDIGDIIVSEVWPDEGDHTYEDIEDRVEIDAWCDNMVHLMAMQDEEWVMKHAMYGDMTTDVNEWRRDGTEMPERVDASDMMAAILRYRRAHRK